MTQFNCGNGTIWNGDCLDLMRHIPSGSVDMILCDLPYGTTACKWDTIIPFAPLWEQYWRIAKPNAAIVLTASQPFTTALISSQIDRFAFSLVWNKQFGGNFVQAKRQQIKTHEDIIIFSKDGTQPNYYPQMIKRDKAIKAGKVEKQPNSAIPNASNQDAIDAVKKKIYDEKYPVSIVDISSRDGERGLHPTQKPVALFEYLIKTYTNPGETVLDNCSGSGTTAIAAQRTGRRFICIEKDLNYYLGSCGRLWKEVEGK